MRKAIWTEWILARFTDRTSAASIIGDLTETADQRGTLWFYISVLRIVISFMWRPSFAFVVAFYAGVTWRAQLWKFLYRGRHIRPNFWWDPSQTIFSISWFGLVLITAAFFAMIRYGLRDKLAQIAFGLCGIYTAFLLYGRIPSIFDGIALVLAIVILCLGFSEGPVPLIALSAVLLIGFSGSLLLLYFTALSENVFRDTLVRSDLDRTLVDIGVSILAALITIKACTSMHDWIHRRRGMKTELETSA